MLIDSLLLGVATIKVRVPDKTSGGRLLTLQMKLDVLVEELYAEIGAKLDVQTNLYGFDWNNLIVWLVKDIIIVFFIIFKAKIN